MKAKLKSRLDVFTDAIIAILITVMVLEMPIGIHAGQVDYPQVFRSIGIYLVSFCFIANLWYQHAIIFNEADSVPNQIIVTDLIFMFFMSLIPTFTRLMTTEITAMTILCYGALCLIISLVFRRIAKTILHEKYTDKGDMQKIYSIIYGSGTFESGVAYLVVIGIGQFYPKIALVLFIIIPIRSFMSHVREFDELTDIDQMDDAGKQALSSMTSADQRKFGHMVRKYMQQARTNGRNGGNQKAAWQEFSQGAKQEFKIDDETLRKWMHNEWHNENEQSHHPRSDRN